MAGVRLATWNVNSLKQRLPRVLEFLDTHSPDVLCVQETKVAADAVPRAELAEAGYAIADHSAGRWAGVAIIARAQPTDVVCGLPGVPTEGGLVFSEQRPDEARWIEATVGGIRTASVYVPNGRALDNPAYAEKLAFLDALGARVAALRTGGAPLVVAGDFNIAPADADVYDPAAFVGGTHVSAAERSRLQGILDAGLVDAFRHVEPDLVQHTWWDYRAGHFHKGLGLRIDLALLSPDLAQRCVRCGMERDFRKGAKPSDHAPLVVDLAD